MKGALHRAIATEVAQRLGWPDPDAVGEGAENADAVEFAHVHGVGTKIGEQNLSSLTHFAGYRWISDRSVWKINLPDREVTFLAGAWPEIPVGLEGTEPLYLLLQVPGYTHAADEMGWPAGWTYAGWLEDCYRELRRRGEGTATAGGRRRLGLVAGMCVHHGQDFTVPQHRTNELLRRHVAFEAAQLRRWRRMGAHRRMTILAEEVDGAVAYGARPLTQALAAAPVPRLYSWGFAMPGRLTKSIREGVRITAGILKHLQGVS